MLPLSRRAPVTDRGPVKTPLMTAWPWQPSEGAPVYRDAARRSQSSCCKPDDWTTRLLSPSHAYTAGVRYAVRVSRESFDSGLRRCSLELDPILANRKASHLSLGCFWVWPFSLFRVPPTVCARNVIFLACHRHRREIQSHWLVPFPGFFQAVHFLECPFKSMRLLPSTHKNLITRSVWNVFCKAFLLFQRCICMNSSTHSL